MLGNLMALMFITMAGLLGFISLEISAYAFLIISYGWWLLIQAASIAGARMTSATLKAFLTADEAAAFSMFNGAIRTPGAGELLSAHLNLLRVAGFVWAGLCVWHELYIHAVLAAGFFFISSGIIARLNPYLYLGRPAQNGHREAIRQLELLRSVQAKREAFFNQEN
jgi:hypothetical protein